MVRHLAGQRVRSYGQTYSARDGFTTVPEGLSRFLTENVPVSNRSSRTYQCGSGLGASITGAHESISCTINWTTFFTVAGC